MLLCPMSKLVGLDNAYTLEVEYSESLLCLCYSHATFLDQSPKRSIVKIVYMAL